MGELRTLPPEQIDTDQKPTIMLQATLSRYTLLRLVGAAALLTVLFLLALGVAAAQDQPPGANWPENVTPDQVYEVARKLWCPLCSGVRLDSCELKACEQMREVIAIKLSEGEDEESIRAYFVEQYGPQVLGEPPREGFNWLAWILPILALIAGGFVLWRRMGRMMRTQSVPIGPSGASSAGQEKDEYERKLEEELAHYD